jgi:hypothetical protein
MTLTWPLEFRKRKSGSDRSKLKSFVKEEKGHSRMTTAWRYRRCGFSRDGESWVIGIDIAADRAALEG